MEGVSTSEQTQAGASVRETGTCEEREGNGVETGESGLLATFYTERPLWPSLALGCTASIHGEPDWTSAPPSTCTETENRILLG